MAEAKIIPSNVPRDRVIDFDIYDFTITDGDYAHTLKKLTAPGLADLLWAPNKGGHWIATRARLSLFLYRISKGQESAQSRLPLVDSVFINLCQRRGFSNGG